MKRSFILSMHPDVWAGVSTKWFDTHAITDKGGMS